MQIRLNYFLPKEFQTRVFRIMHFFFVYLAADCGSPSSGFEKICLVLYDFCLE